MKLPIGALVEFTEDVNTFLSGDTFKAGEPLAILGPCWSNRSMYALRPWPLSKTDRRRVVVRRAGKHSDGSEYPIRVIGTAFEVPKKMDHWVGRIVVVQRPIILRKGGTAFNAGDRAVVLHHYRGRLSLGYLPHDPRYIAPTAGCRQRPAVLDADRHYQEVILEPLCPSPLISSPS